MTAVNEWNPGAVVTLFLVVALTEGGIPLPFILDTVLFYTSFQYGPVSVQVLSVFLIIFWGRQFGAAIVYWVTRFLGTTFFNWLGKRFPSILTSLGNIDEKLQTNAALTVAIPRLAGLMTFASVTSGALRLRYSSFVLGVGLSSVIFDGSLILLGYLTRQGFNYLGFSPHPWQIIVVLIVIICMVWLIRYYFVRRKSHQKSS